MSCVNDKPTKQNFPINIIHANPEKKKEYFNDMFEKFVNIFILQIDSETEYNVEDDYVKTIQAFNVTFTNERYSKR